MIDFWIFPLSTIWGAYHLRASALFDQFLKADVMYFLLF